MDDELRVKQLEEKCIVCGHPCRTHVKYDPYMNMHGNTMASAMQEKHDGCLATVWVKDAYRDVSYERESICGCPLKPSEVLHNAGWRSENKIA